MFNPGTNLTGFVWIIGLIIALVCCFTGYRLNRLISTITGFIFGIALGSFLLGRFADMNGIFRLVLLILIGVILALIFFALKRFGMFLFCFALVFLTVWSMAPAFETLPVLIGLAAGLVAAIASVIAERPVTIVITAFCGGWWTAVFLSYMTGIDPLGILAVITVILTAAGSIVQFRTTESEKARRRRQQEEDVRNRRVRYDTIYYERDPSWREQYGREQYRQEQEERRRRKRDAEYDSYYRDYAGERYADERYFAGDNPTEEIDDDTPVDFLGSPKKKSSSRKPRRAPYDEIPEEYLARKRQRQDPYGGQDEYGRPASSPTYRMHPTQPIQPATEDFDLSDLQAQLDEYERTHPESKK